VQQQTPPPSDATAPSSEDVEADGYHMLDAALAKMDGLLFQGASGGVGGDNDEDDNDNDEDDDEDDDDDPFGEPPPSSLSALPPFTAASTAMGRLLRAWARSVERVDPTLSDHLGNVLQRPIVPTPSSLQQSSLPPPPPLPAAGAGTAAGAAAGAATAAVVEEEAAEEKEGAAEAAAEAEEAAVAEAEEEGGASTTRLRTVRRRPCGAHCAMGSCRLTR